MELSEVDLDSLSADMWSDIQKKRKPETSKRTFLWTAVATAACLIIAFGSVLYLYKGNSDQGKPTQALLQDVRARGNKAYLILADGKKISLTDVSSGTIATQAGIKITKTPNGELVYTVSDQKAIEKSDQYNIIETPRGGQYQVNLPDGTKVWLNAASSLKYPANFSSKKERNVELTGEAYFEVAKMTTKGDLASKGRKMPFVVISGKQKIEVLGTHFNVNAYSDEEGIRTTLLEGAVKVNDRIVLQPGEQSTFASGKLSVKPVTASDMIDWKNDEFIFNRDSLTDIMRKISRWYDVNIVYQRSQSDMPTFSGSVSRFENVSAVLKMLEETGNVHFSIEGKTIKVK